MIKSVEGETFIKGTNFDILFDFDCITRALLKEHPEAVVSWITNNRELIDEGAHRCGNLELASADFVYTRIARTIKELE